jgi:hypothetical protein
MIVATLESSGQQVANLIRDGVPKDKLFPLRQQTAPKRRPADAVRTGNGQHA